MDIKGQLSLEFVIIAGLMLTITLCLAPILGNDIELTQAMGAARNGAIKGANINSFAIYPEDVFENYTNENLRLINPVSVKIVEINYKNYGFNATYNKTRIQLRITASAPSIKNSKDKNSLGDRINFYARKSICESFGTSNLTNKLYNPVFSSRYVFTTADVRWT